MDRLIDQVVGHEQQIQNLQYSWTAGRWPSALLLAGPSGVGKRQVGWGLIQWILCEEHSEIKACGACPSCRNVAKHQSESILAIEPENDQIKVDKAQEVVRFISLRAWRDERFVFIDEVHLLNPQAGNALLKSIEEPPDKTFFIMTSSNLPAVMPTIRSRSQVLRFSPLSQEQLGSVVEAPDWVLRAAHGRVDVAQWLQSEDLVNLRETGCQAWMLWLGGRPNEAYSQLRDIVKSRDASLSLVRLWQQWIRDAWLLKSEDPRLVHQDQRELLEALAQQEYPTLDWLYGECRQLEREFLTPVDKGLALESFLRTSTERMASQ